MATISKQELSIRANLFISHFKEVFDDSPLTISRPPSTENPEVTIIHGEDHSFMTFEFKPSVVQTADATYVVNDQFDEVTFRKIAEDIKERLL